MPESDAATSAEANKPAKPSAAQETLEIVKTVVYALLIALVIRVLLFQPFTIPSASMEPNLLQGDYIIVSKYAYGYSRHSAPLSPPLFQGRVLMREPKRGDVIVFKLPRDGRTDYIKRLIGVPGDRVQLRGGVIYLNGEPVRREKLASQVDLDSFGLPQMVEVYRETLPGGRSFLTYDQGPGREVDDTEEFVVPAGHYFFMGDNRDNSQDSRYPESIGVGFVPAENLVGKAEIILLSWNADASLFKPWTWFLDARPGRFFNLLK